MSTRISPPRGFRLTAGQRELLVLVHVLGGSRGSLDFQKLLFLRCQELPEPPYYFVPYRYGAFSFASYADRRKLVEHGLLEDAEAVWKLSAKGIELAAAEEASVASLLDFADRYRKLRGDALVAETYRRYPFYATRSEIAARVLREDSETIQRIENARTSIRAMPVATIGYEGRSLDQYLGILIKAGATILCDLRRNPLSRKYGFSKGTLANACAGVGIRYEHLPELGIASALRQDLDDEASYQRLFTDYRRNALPRQQPALERIRTWIEAGERVALTCFELQPQMCHRHCVADALVEQFGDQFVPSHL